MPQNLSTRCRTSCCRQGQFGGAFFAVHSNMSERVGTTPREEMDFSGPVRMSDVEEVQLRVVQSVRQLEEAGQITIVRGDSNDIFV